MLSILIPTYNYDTVPLVTALQQQVIRTGMVYEILCFDDASTLFLKENETLKTLPNVKYVLLEENIGRSKIRNLLAEEAQYSWLLFLDADVLPKSESFVSNYLPYLNDEIKIVNGGVEYGTTKPIKEKTLRWVYGHNREALPCETREKKPYLSLLTLNFLTHKSVFKNVSFNETIPNLRHEDTLFSYNLMQNKIPIQQIDNPIYHLGLDPFPKAIQKEKESVTALKYLLDHQLIPSNYIKIARVFATLKRLRLVLPFHFVFHLFKKGLLRNLASNNPSLVLFDLYRLGYLCQIEKENPSIHFNS